MGMISRLAGQFFVLLCLCAVLVGIMTITILPHIAKSQFTATLEQLGFEAIEIEKTSTGLGKIRFENVTFGEDKFSHIKHATLRYNPVTYLIFRRISAMDIQAISLTGEITPTDGFSIAGWHIPAEGAPLTIPDINAIDIRDSHIELLSAEMGGIDLQFSTQIQKQADIADGLRVLAHINSAQKNLRFTGKIEGTYTPDAGLNIKLSYENGSITAPALRISRATGMADFTFAPQTPTAVKGDFNVGGLTLNNLPWQGVAGTIDGTTQNFKILGNGRATGKETVEMAFQVQKNETAIRAGGALYAKNSDDMIAYLKTHMPPQSGIDVIAPISALGGKPDVYLDFVIENLGTENPKNIIYRTRPPYDARGMVSLSQKDEE